MQIYLIPLIFDYILYGIFFIVSFRMAESGSALLTGAPMVIWGLPYSAVSYLLGKVVDSRNAVHILRFSGILTALVSLLFFIDGLYIQLLFTGLMGVAGACFCTPFQIVAGDREEGNAGGAGKAAALYTFSLSLGPAVSPVVFGCFDVKTGFWINAALGVVMTLLVTANKNHNAGNTETPESDTPGSQMLPVWIFCGTAVLIVSLLGMLQPFRAVEIHLDRAVTGWAAALIKIPQAFAGLALICAGNCLCRQYSIIITTAAGIAGLLLMSSAGSAAGFLSGSAVWGASCGAVYMYFVYSALSDREHRARNVSINEMLQGICCIAGPALGGVLTSRIGSVHTFFCCIFLLAGAAAASLLLKNKTKINIKTKPQTIQ